MKKSLLSDKGCFAVEYLCKIYLHKLYLQLNLEKWFTKF